MLIFIGESVVEALKDKKVLNSEKNKIVEVLSDILYAQNKGRHIVNSDFKSLDSLDKYFKNKKNPFEQSIIHKIKRKFSSHNSVFKKIQKLFYVDIVYKDPTVKNGRFNDHIIININCTNKGFKFLELETTLLCEHLADTDFYRYVAEHYMNKEPNYKSKLHIAFQAFCGGGSAIGSCYDYFCESESSFCLAITDNDIKYNGYTPPKSSTSNTIAKIDNARNPYNCKHHIIGVRDIENLIPRYMIDVFCHNQVEFIKRELSNTKIDDFILYFDYKLGININKEDFKDPNILADRKSMFPNVDFNRRIGNNNNLVIEGFGKDIMSNVVNGLVNQSILIKETEFHNIVRDQWEEIGRLIFSRCCAIKLK